MPNWCEVEIAVTGPKKDLEALLSACQMMDDDGELSYSLLGGTMPAPRGLTEAKRMEWCTERYGCTDRDYSSDVLVYDDMLVFDVLTRWVPPRVGIVAISQRWPALEFDVAYAEPMLEVLGGFRIKGGRIILNLCDSFLTGDDDDDIDDADWWKQ